MFGCADADSTGAPAADRLTLEQVLQSPLSGVDGLAQSGPLVTVTTTLTSGSPRTARTYLSSRLRGPSDPSTPSYLELESPLGQVTADYPVSTAFDGRHACIGSGTSAKRFIGACVRPGTTNWAPLPSIPRAAGTVFQLFTSAGRIYCAVTSTTRSTPKISLLRLSNGSPARWRETDTIRGQQLGISHIGGKAALAVPQTTGGVEAFRIEHSGKAAPFTTQRAKQAFRGLFYSPISTGPGFSSRTGWVVALGVPTRGGRQVRVYSLKTGRYTVVPMEGAEQATGFVFNGKTHPWIVIQRVLPGKQAQPTPTELTAIPLLRPPGQPGAFGRQRKISQGPWLLAPPTLLQTADDRYVAYPTLENNSIPYRLYKLAP